MTVVIWNGARTAPDQRDMLPRAFPGKYQQEEQQQKGAAWWAVVGMNELNCMLCMMAAL
jgi:hypothetical protein